MLAGMRDLTLPTHPRPASAAERSSAVVHQLQRSGTFRLYQPAFEAITGLPLALRQLGSFQLPFERSKRVDVFHVLAADIKRWCALRLELEDRLERAAAMETATLEMCGGWREAAIPVRIGKCLVGHLRTGQVFFEPPTKRNFDAFVSQLGVPLAADRLAKLESAYLQTRVMAQKQYEAILGLLSIFARHIAATANPLLIDHGPNEIPAIAKARAFVEGHLTEDIRLEDGARAAGMSGFYFCKLFHRLTGLTFTGYLARRRVEAVKEALRNPNTRVCEAAYAAGFQSLSQFNRVFRRVAGETPSSFRRSLHAVQRQGRSRGR